MARYRWRTEEDGTVIVTEPPAVIDVVLRLEGAQESAIARVEDNWGDMCREAIAGKGIPDGWLQAMIYRESGGNPMAFRREPNGWTGVGLLQITHPSLKKGAPDSEVFYPRANLEIGAVHIAGLIKRYGADFPRIAAAFNAGSVRDSDANPWGMVSTGNHVTAEVSALNSWVQLMKKRRAEKAARVAEKQAGLFDLTELARDADEAARKA